MLIQSEATWNVMMVQRLPVESNDGAAVEMAGGYPPPALAQAPAPGPSPAKRLWTTLAAVVVAMVVACALILAAVAAMAAGVVLTLGALASRMMGRRGGVRGPEGWTLETAPRRLSSPA